MLKRDAYDAHPGDRAMTSRSRTADPSPLCAPAYVSDAPTPGSWRVFPLILALLFLLLLPILFPPASAAAAPPASAPTQEYMPFPALIDLRTTFSDGEYDPDTLVQMALSKGFEIVFFNDHDRVALEYGLPPFLNWLKIRKELNSINVAGADRYLRTLKGLRKVHPQTVLIPGTESTPFYFWTGSPLAGTLTANDPERRILTMGLEKPEDYETLPVLHNRPYGIQLRDKLPALFAFGLAFLIGLYLLFHRGVWRLAGFIFALLGAGLFANTLCARPSPFDAYHGRQGAAPYQLFIDAVNQKGGLTFWNYPETRSGMRPLGPIHVNTPPYPDMLLETKNYTGFAALYGDTITITEPGNVWDIILKEYCGGFRSRPPWGIATADYHKEGGAGQKLGDFQTVLWLKEKSTRSVLDALRTGRMYACQGRYPEIPRLDEFSVTGADGGAPPRAISGEELSLPRNPRIRIRLSGGEEGKHEVQVRLIRSGTLIQTFVGTLPLDIDYVDEWEAPGERIYYRMDMSGHGKIVSNPIFVTCAP